MPYLLACVLLGFTAMFNRSRFIAPIIIALFVYHFIRERLQVPLAQEKVMAMFAGLNILFCLQLVISAIVPEKGLFNSKGSVFIGLLVCGDILLWYYGDALWWITWLATIEIQQVSLFETQFWITQALVLCHSVTFICLGLVSIIRRTPADFALLLTWLTGVLVFFDFSFVDVSSVCFSALCLALFVFFQQSNYQVTYKDALTGISGRRALDDYLTTLGRHYAIAMLDVDHFKKFNDTHGHDVGDQVLRMVASRIAKVEGGGKAFRFGGEEFTVVFNRRTANDIFVYLEAVRESIQQYEMTLRSDEREIDKQTGQQQRGKKAKPTAKTVSVTISIGVANSQSGYSPKDVIKSADDLLYRAKDAGRNCTIR
jgi:diguanylate cyclase (GGDEF)-like protein